LVKLPHVEHLGKSCFRIVQVIARRPATSQLETARRNARRRTFSSSKIMSGQIMKVSVSLAILAASTASLFTISWIGLALLGF
jgi:hypothetical protein